MNIAKLSIAALLLTLVGCSSKSTGTSGTEQDRGLEGEGQTVADSAPDKNPDGVPYPTANIGTSARSGARAGNVIQNYKFVGYRNADVSGGLQPISLADFYDPETKNYKLIHIVASAVWCGPCQHEAQLSTAATAKFKERKVVWLVSLVEGAKPGTGSVQKDLDGWIDEFKSPHTHWLDSSNKNFGAFYDAAAVPWNANINPKTMEILSAKTGGFEGEADLLADLDGWIKKIDSGEVK